MRRLSRLRFPRLVIIFTVVVGLYLYSSVNGEALITRLNQLPIEVERRVQWWDWKDTPEEKFCRAGHEAYKVKDDIPNLVHFVMLSEKGEDVELSYAQYLAIKAAILRLNVPHIKVHTYGLNTQNPWWKAIKDHVTLVKVDRDEVLGPHGLWMNNLLLPHQADVLRLAILQREGGIYMDTDVYALKPFTDLLSNPRDAVLGHEGGNRYGLCNAIILARAGSAFILEWEQSYKTFNPRRWNEHSVRVPKRLQVRHPHLVCPLSPTVFFWPTWPNKHVHYMHDSITPDEAAAVRANMSAFGGTMYENQLAYHAVGYREHMQALTPEDVQLRDSRFNLLVRDIANAPL